jgi:hypothetical protein
MIVTLDRKAKREIIEQISENIGGCVRVTDPNPPENFKPRKLTIAFFYVRILGNTLTIDARTSLKRQSPGGNRVTVIERRRERKFSFGAIASRTSRMQPQLNNSTNAQPGQDRLGYANLGGEQEGKGSKARYLTQLYIMLRTARRNGWALVVCALRELIARYRGIA